MHHYVWQRGWIVYFFLHLLITMKVDATHLQWILQNLSSVWLEDHKPNIRLGNRTRVFHSLSLSSQLISPSPASQFHYILGHCFHLISPRPTAFSSPSGNLRKTPRPERRARSACVLHEQWDKSLFVTDNQQTSNLETCFDFFFQKWNFQRLVSALSNVFQNDEVSTPGQVKMIILHFRLCSLYIKGNRKRQTRVQL